ncbi:LOW QUALITY PROTEIN: hypothetical protein PHMEG_000557 [Phytophthora megakarya]|uniref:Uncharacterized protein n=1 Tax=Phytophthora megakarya TaxID=4795 RepID=A0A225X530_9STRA|nr:LOW QUALITY PROTEIN: hypothetical protein PHMEG_000557 [Phytophthora megakarya]
MVHARSNSFVQLSTIGVFNAELKTLECGSSSVPGSLPTQQPIESLHKVIKVITSKGSNGIGVELRTDTNSAERCYEPIFGE